LRHLIEIIADLNRRGIGFRSLTESIDTTTAGGRLTFHIFGALAQFERDIIRERTLAEGKPEKVVDKIVDGRMEKYFSESVLLEQPFVKDPDKTVGELIAERIGKIGENIQVRRFARFKLGEGIEKKSADFAAEVAAQAGA